MSRRDSFGAQGLSFLPHCIRLKIQDATATTKLQAKTCGFFLVLKELNCPSRGRMEWWRPVLPKSPHNYWIVNVCVIKRFTVAPKVASILGTQHHNWPGAFLIRRITEFHLAQELERKRPPRFSLHLVNRNILVVDS